MEMELEMEVEVGNRYMGRDQDERLITDRR